MTALADVRPAGLDLLFRPGTTVTLTTQPFDWGNGHILRVQARYIAAPGA